MSSILVTDIYTTSIWFILHSITITTALTWNEAITRVLNTYNSNVVKHHFIYAILLTLVSVLLHITLGKYARKPSDTEDSDTNEVNEVKELKN
jgi:hypothetical protein